jgi:hypothetical protein
LRELLSSVRGEVDVQGVHVEENSSCRVFMASNFGKKLSKSRRREEDVVMMEGRMMMGPCLIVPNYDAELHMFQEAGELDMDEVERNLSLDVNLECQGKGK